MNRLLLEEVIESNRLRKNNALSFLCLLILPSVLLAQVERTAEKIFLNGFGRYIFIDNQINLFNLFSFDVDGDGYTDIGGLDESGKNVFIYYGKGFNNFTQPIKYSLGYKYSGLIVRKLNINNQTNLILYSRLDGTIAVYSFWKRSLSRTLTIKIDCCFSDLIAVNLDGTRELELAAYGANYSGIGIISFKNLSYTYKKVGHEFFSKLVPFNLNSDDKVDFVGFNSKTRELVLLRNITAFNYSKNIYKRYDESINEIHAGNFDDDLINDIALISNESKLIYILNGNGIGSFSSHFNFKLTSNYSSSLIFDYNRDLIDDFISYDRFNKKMYINSISNDQRQIISHPVIILNQLFSMASYRTTTTKGVAVSSEQGLFLLVYSSLSFKSQIYSLTSTVSDIETLRSADELYPRIFVLDTENRKLNIILRNEFNSPQEIFSFPLSFAYEKVKILSHENENLILVCFKPLTYFFDYFVINLKTGKYLREILTVDGLIKDIFLEKLSREKPLLGVIVESKNDLRIILIKPQDFNKILLNEIISPVPILDYAFDISTRTLYFLSRSPKNEIELISKVFDGSYRKSELYKIFSVRDENYLSIKLLICDLFKDLRVGFLNI